MNVEKHPEPYAYGVEAYEGIMQVLERKGQLWERLSNIRVTNDGIVTYKMMGASVKEQLDGSVTVQYTTPGGDQLESTGRADGGTLL